MTSTQKLKPVQAVKSILAADDWYRKSPYYMASEAKSIMANASDRAISDLQPLSRHPNPISYATAQSNV